MLWIGPWEFVEWWWCEPSRGWKLWTGVGRKMGNVIHGWDGWQEMTDHGAARVWRLVDDGEGGETWARYPHTQQLRQQWQ